jgi:glycosyltransferase involved in cell wall biosynthesis
MITKDKVWIVNDLLTCIPGTKTFWHLLLDIDGTIDKTGNPFSILSDKIEKDEDACDLIIRNGTFFRWIDRDCKTISFIQDCYDGDETQRACIANSDMVVFNSEWTRNKYAPTKEHRVIPIGVNQDLFRPNGYHSIFDKRRKVGIFVGDYNATKNTRMFESICGSRPDLDFIYVSKSSNSIKHSNVKNVRGGVDERGMVELYNSADFCIMCSPIETLHLTTIEAALCDIPVIGPSTGWLASHYSPKVGELIQDCNDIGQYLEAIDRLLKTPSYEPRDYMLNDTPYTWSACKKDWEEVINEVLSH